MMKLWIICLAHHKEIGSKMEIKGKGRCRDPGGGEAEAGGGMQVKGCRWRDAGEGCRWRDAGGGMQVEEEETEVGEWIQ